MAGDDTEIDIIDVDSCSDLDDKDVRQNASPPNGLDLTKENSEQISDSLVSARTDGIRGKRYLDYNLQPSSGAESGELTDSDVDVDIVDIDVVDVCIVGITENKENEKSNKIKNIVNEGNPCDDNEVKKSVVVKAEVMDEGNPCIEENRFSSASSQKHSNFAFQRPAEIVVRAEEDLKGIISLMKTEPIDHKTYDGASKLLSDHRQVKPVIDDSSDDDNFVISDSDSGADSDYNIPMSVTSEVRKMEGMNIKDRYFMETYPEVEIIDLTLTESEQINPLGKVHKIVEDFVVVNSCNCDKILDLDSMIFDEGRKCVGYVFEVLGPVKEPYYSIRFNTNSDIANLGLHNDQELFYSPNERYSRYVMVELLRELEHSSRYKRNSDGDSKNSDCSSSESESEETPENPSRPKVGTKRKPKKQLQNRTTPNYSVNYQSVNKQPKHHYNSFTDQWKPSTTPHHVYNKPNPTPPQAAERTFINPRQSAPNSSQSFTADKKNGSDAMSYDSLYNTVKTNQNRNTPNQTQVNSFKSSIMASFLDPFSLEKTDD